MPHPTDARDFRLPTQLRPIRYDAFLSLDPAAKEFTGTLRLDLEIGQAADEIVLHAADLALSRATASISGRRVEAASVTRAPASETVILRFPEMLPPGPLVLDVAWTGKVGPGLRGLYDAGSGILATQFEAADARRVFPCLDEPCFKAPWRIAVEAPRDAVVLSNGAPIPGEPAPARREEVPEAGARPGGVGAPEGGRRRVTFTETPPLPTYLVAIVAGRVDSRPEGRAGPVPVRTWSSPEKTALTAFGQEVALEVLPRLEAYFGVPYAFGKLDQVGLPEFEAGAMENAGLVTYRELALLLDPATASLAQQKRVAEVVTHELAHQWFGNWVTMSWWDDLWLNEAFATWMAYKIVDGWRPGWRVWLDFDQGRAAAMQLDAQSTTHPVRAEVRSVAEAGEAFDLITYEKGGAVLRMIEGYLGAERFREGIRLYMRRHARGNAVADDLWGALGEASGEPVVELANSWIRKPGFPLVRARREGRRLVLEQERFRSSGRGTASGPAETWPIPMVLRVISGGGSVEQRFLLRDRAAAVELAGAAEPEAVVLNAGATGFYRSAPDAASLEALGRHLGRLAPAERISILSDGWSLVRAGERGADAFLELLTRFGGEEDHAVLDEMVARLSTIEHRLLDEPHRPAFSALVATLLGPALAQLGWDPSPDEPDAVRLRRAAAVRALGLVARSTGVALEAAARVERLAGGDRGALEPNLLDPAVALAARGGGPERFERFRALFAAEKEPAMRRRWLLGLASFEDAALARRGVDLAMAGEVPLQDVAGFAGALLANRSARAPFWERLRAGWDGYVARLAGAPMLVRRVVEALGWLVERRELEEAEAFLAAHPLEEARQAVAQTLERLREDVGLRERSRDPVGRWLAARSR
jgi:puromycin-sensitive aminopeptidase